MRLFVTAPLTLDPKLVVNKIKEAAPELQQLIVTEEFRLAYSNELKLLVSPENLLVFPLESSNFGECAEQVRLIEMTYQCTTVMVIKPKTPGESALVPEPRMNMRSLASIIDKYCITPLVIEL